MTDKSREAQHNTNTWKESARGFKAQLVGFLTMLPGAEGGQGGRPERWPSAASSGVSSALHGRGRGRGRRGPIRAKRHQGQSHAQGDPGGTPQWPQGRPAVPHTLAPQLMGVLCVSGKGSDLL